MRVRIFGSWVMATAAACSSSGGGTQKDLADTARDAAATDGGSPSPLEDASVDSPGEATASIGPIDVAANEEKTVCITKHLGNGQSLVVSSITASLAPGSHHLIVYRVTDTQENLTPTACMPFTGLVANEASPLALINRDQFLATLPSGVGIGIAESQMVRVEAHYINPGATAIQGKGTVTFHGIPAASSPPWQPADFAFWGTTNIQIPAHSTATVGPLFQAGIAGTHLISLSTHQHSLGTDIKVWGSAKPGDLSSLLTNQTDWASPAWQSLTPPIDFDGNNGLSYECSWNNTTAHAVSFGESALDEMCFVGGFYYPSKGFDLCINQGCQNRTAGDAGTSGTDAGTEAGTDAGTDAGTTETDAAP
jgi:hypothetical protein